MGTGGGGMERSGEGASWGTPGSDSGTWEASGRLLEGEKKEPSGLEENAGEEQNQEVRDGEQKHGRMWGTVGSEAAKARWEGTKMRARWCPQTLSLSLCGSTIADQRLCHFTFTCFSCPYKCFLCEKVLQRRPPHPAPLPRWPVPRTLGQEEYSYIPTQPTSPRAHTSQACPATGLCMDM